LPSLAGAPVSLAITGARVLRLIAVLATGAVYQLALDPDPADAWVELTPAAPTA
jgi:hypothetical protein